MAKKTDGTTLANKAFLFMILFLTNEKISEITNKNMFYKNMLSQLGIFLIQ